MTRRLFSARPLPRSITLTLSLAVACVACSTGSTDSPPVFGGEGARIESPGEMPLPADTSSEKARGGPCAEPAPAGQDTLLEDFEDGDNHLFKVLDRDGWWFTATDDTQGTVEPPAGQFEAARLESNTTNNMFAAHWKADGYSDWGVTWGTTLEWVKEGIKCPFNASAFSGMKLRAKGSGKLRINFGNPATVPLEHGGECRQGCWDTHSKVIHLTPEWMEYVIRFDRLQQGGWGTQAPFAPERILTLNFHAGPEALPVEAWVDDLQWIRADASTEPTTSTPPAAGAAPEPTAAPPASAAGSATTLPETTTP